MDWTTLVHTATKAISVKGVNSEEDNLKKVEDLDDDELEITQRWAWKFELNYGAL